MKDSALNNKQKKFVEEYLKSMNATKAAKNSGYSEKTAYSIGQRLLKNVEIQAAIDSELDAMHEKQKKVFIRAADSAINALIDTVENGRGLARVNAANSLLDRAGHKPIERVQAEVTEVIDGDEVRSKLLEGLLKEMPETPDRETHSETES
jgi:phage terminase small subunit